MNIPDSNNVLTVQHEHVDRKIVNEIFQKDTQGSFRNWSQQDIDLVTTMFQIPHGMCGYDMTPNVIVQISPLVIQDSHCRSFS